MTALLGGKLGLVVFGVSIYHLAPFQWFLLLTFYCQMSVTKRAPCRKVYARSFSRTNVLGKDAVL